MPTFSRHGLLCNFDPISAGLAMGGIGMIGGYFQGKEQTKQTEATNANNLAIAREQMAFQERMSSSAHQREVQDLRKAGLNPILSATGGSGASSPQGASATMQAPRAYMGDVLRDSMNTGLSVANVAADLDIKNATVAKTLADTANSLETAKVIGEDITSRRLSNARQRATYDEDVERVHHETTSARYSASQRKAESERSRTQLMGEQAELKGRKDQAEIDNDLRKYDNTINRVQGAIDTATSAFNVSRYLRSPTIRSGSKAETRALEKAGAKGLRVK